MNELLSWKRILQSLVAPGCAVLLCVVFLVWALKLWQADLRVPFCYYGDSLFTEMWVKGVIEQGWYLHNDRLGAPARLEMHDFPMADNLHFLILKALSLFVPDFAVVTNLYFMLTFPLTTLTAYFVWRRFHLSAGVCVVVSLLFAFLPYHLLRHVNHLFLASYYLVPPMVLVICRLYQDPPLLFRRTDGNGRLRFHLGCSRSLLALAICLLTASAGVYYAFFACFFLLVAGLGAWVQKKIVQPLLAAGVLIAVLFCGYLANIAPSLHYAYHHGLNASAFPRTHMDAEVYGLKIAQLLLPVQGHQWSWLRNLRTWYDSASLVNENSTATLGALGSLGFLLLIGRLLLRAPARSPARLEEGLVTLNAAAVLLATIGGLGSVFALLVSPAIRAYNRISVYIAFFSLSAVALLLHQVAQKYVVTSRQRVLFQAFLGLLLCAGIWDQTSRAVVPRYHALKAEFESDAAFIRQVEAALPEGALVFQLPYVTFPIRHRTYHSFDHDHLRGYLHSKTLRWSYGAMVDREGDLWQETVAHQPLEDMLQTLALAGFSGIYLDRHCYDDAGASLEAQLARLLQTPAVRSANQRFAFFDMQSYTADLRRACGEEAWQVRREAALHPVRLEWRRGFSSREGIGDSKSRWCCSATAELHLVNPSTQDKTIQLNMRLKTLRRRPARLAIRSCLFADQMDIDEQGLAFARTLTVPPGTWVIHFRCEGRPVRLPHDGRTLVFRVENYGVKEREWLPVARK
jgi:phosphoglycerol transferase